MFLRGTSEFPCDAPPNPLLAEEIAGMKARIFRLAHIYDAIDIRVSEPDSFDDTPYLLRQLSPKGVAFFTLSAFYSRFQSPDG